MDLTAALMIWALTGYLLGSIPFGFLLTRLGGKGDIRNIGSGNIGATNVLRSGSKVMAAATLLLDGGKGAAAYLLANYYAPEAALIAALAAFVGHLFPVWLGFKGGKGVATFAGICFAISVWLGFMFCAVWLVTALLFRYSSLGSLLATTAAPLYAYLFILSNAWMALLVMAVMVFWRHESNIRRLLSGTEPKIGSPE